MEDVVREGDVLDGKFRVERVLGRGGMGIVVVAQHLQLGQRVAIKFLRPEAIASAEVVARFQREARAAAQLQSENVVRVTDVARLDSGVPYMVMEFLRGSDLGQVVRERGPFAVVDAVDLVLQACAALAEAHALGIVHRDLKPSNLFLTKRLDGSPLLKVLDFGISKLTKRDPDGSVNMTATAAVLGSPMYMSPEQVRSSKDVDSKTDIWSLGVVLHELLTGAPVFLAHTPSAVMAMIVADEPNPVRKARPDVPSGLERIILRCLQKDRTKRYASVGDLALALAAFGSARGKASAALTIQILQSASPTTATQKPSGNPPDRAAAATGDSWWNTTRFMPMRHRKIALSMIGGIAMVLIGVSVVTRWNSRAFPSHVGSADVPTEVPSADERALTKELGTPSSTTTDTPSARAKELTDAAATQAIAVESLLAAPVVAPASPQPHISVVRTPLHPATIPAKSATPPTAASPASRDFLDTRKF